MQQSPDLVPPAHTTVELGALLRQYELGLVLIAGADADTAVRPIQWVHASELRDPTPFLTPRTVLLTTGSQFAGARGEAAAGDYVLRLRDAGVAALGFGVGLHWERIPNGLIAACEQHGFPLVRVPYDTPFIAIVQTAARLLDARTHVRDVWTLESQRAVAVAALQREGLAAALHEAASRLRRWIAITDRSGTAVALAPPAARGAAGAEWLRREARNLIARGTRAGRVVGAGDDSVQLQTLGRGGRLLGALVVEGGGAPDPAERALIGLVAALATLELEHREARDESETALRVAVVRLLLAGEMSLATEVAAGVLPRLPHGSLVVLRVPAAETLPSHLRDDLRSATAARPGVLAAPLDGAGLVVCESARVAPLLALLEGSGAAVGVSQPGDLSELADLRRQAERAAERAAASPVAPGVLHYRATMHADLLGLLDRAPAAQSLAASLLAPIRRHDRRGGEQLEPALRTWLAHHGQMSPAAAALGIHRHTLRARVQSAGALLERELNDPATRAELWAALRLSPAPDHPPGAAEPARPAPSGTAPHPIIPAVRRGPSRAA